MKNILAERIPQLSLNEFVKEVTMGKMGSDLMDISKKIAVIRHVGIRKTKLISSPIKKDDGLSTTEDQNLTEDEDLDELSVTAEVVVDSNIEEKKEESNTETSPILETT